MRGPFRTMECEFNIPMWNPGPGFDSTPDISNNREMSDVGKQTCRAGRKNPPHWPRVNNVRQTVNNESAGW